ncbi:hypothetical protein [Streptomyces roseifaciens]|uniref:hypothetical protein n=1 Tax=Streptomyces roseifaciens TaxID=1488406 RepID=UPI000717E70D|nr:hypothetical protein [Streptomyces roseifaciens]
MVVSQAHFNPLTMQLTGLYAHLTDTRGIPVIGRKVEFYSASHRLLASAWTDEQGEAVTDAAMNLGPSAVQELMAGGSAVFLGDEEYTEAGRQFSITVGTGSGWGGAG